MRTSENNMRESRKALYWSKTKYYRQNGVPMRITAEVKLADDCKNGVMEFTITADIYEQRKNGRWIFSSCGCLHDEIAKHFPELAKYIPLHLCNYMGQPSYPEENGRYFLNQGIEQGMNYLRITREEAEELLPYCEREEMPYFKYLLYSLGIVARWRREANEFIEFIENKLGCTWENPYNPDTEKFVLRISDEEVRDIEEKKKNGYFSRESAIERKNEKERKQREEERQQIIDFCESKCASYKADRDMMLYILDSGIPIKNVIYYQHTNEVVFNWKDYGDKITREDFDKFVAGVDYSKLPKGVKFSIKYEA